MLYYILHLLLHLTLFPTSPLYPPFPSLPPLFPSPLLPQPSSLRGWATMKSLCTKRSDALHWADTQPTHTCTHKHTHTHTHTHTHAHRDRQTLIHPHTADSNSMRSTKGTDSQGHCIVWPHNEPDETDNTHTQFFFILFIVGGVGPCLLHDAVCVRSNITAHPLLLWLVTACHPAFTLTFSETAATENALNFEGVTDHI